jgi:protein required for attachment to host cells
MDTGGSTWVVVADAERVRVLLERTRGGDLIELHSEALSQGGDERPQSHRRFATVHESVGAGRHGAGERDVGHEAAQRFFHRVAQRLEARLHERAFDSLAIIAPPRALGLLKSALDGKVSARLTAADARDCIDETPERVRGRLRHARAETWSR